MNELAASFGELCALYPPCYSKTFGSIKSCEEVRPHAGASSDTDEIWQSSGSPIFCIVIRFSFRHFLVNSNLVGSLWWKMANGLLNKIGEVFLVRSQRDERMHA